MGFLQYLKNQYEENRIYKTERAVIIERIKTPETEIAVSVKRLKVLYPFEPDEKLLRVIVRLHKDGLLRNYDPMQDEWFYQGRCKR